MVSDDDELHDQDPLPVSVALAWGLRKPGSRGPKPSLSLDQIVAAGIALADRDGLPEVSMARVARAVGVSTMALYRYVPTKTDLLILMGDVAVGPPADLAADLTSDVAAGRTAGPGGFREPTEQWMRSILVAYSAHPWVLAVPLSSPPALPNQLAWLDALLRALGDTLSYGDRLSAALFIDSYVRGWASTLHAVQQTSHGQPRSFPAVLVDPLSARYPALAPMMRSGDLDIDEPATGPEQQLAFSIARILDGLQVLMSQPQPQQLLPRPTGPRSRS